MLIFIIILILILFFVQARSKIIDLNDVFFESKLSKSSAEINEEVELISTVTNKTHKFIPYIRMIEKIPSAATPKNKKIKVHARSFANTSWFYNSSLYLMARSKFQRKLKISFNKRGMYVFPGATLNIGDFLGMSSKPKQFFQSSTIVIYPQKMNSAYLDQIIGGFLGEISVRRFIMEDPILNIGTREYTGREPLKQVSWSHTARTGQMMAKKYDYTTEMNVILFLDVSDANDEFVTEDVYEVSYSLARSVSEQLNHAKIPFEFTTNAITAGTRLSEQHGKIEQNLGKSHLQFICNMLGRCEYGAIETFEEVMEKMKEGVRANQSQSVIIITPDRDIQKERIIKSIKTGYPIAVAFIYANDFKLQEQKGTVA